MLIPRRVKHRKQHHPDRTGPAKGGTRVTFGEYGVQALEPAYITNRQIEAARPASVLTPVVPWEPERRGREAPAGRSRRWRRASAATAASRSLREPVGTSPL